MATAKKEHIIDVKLLYRVMRFVAPLLKAEKHKIDNVLLFLLANSSIEME